MMVIRFGLTWWGQRWIGALEALGATYTNRLPRGRTYARNGSVQDLTIKPGEVTARVRGSRPSPYKVRLRLPVFTDAQWTAATHALAGQLRHAAALLDGRMPEDIDETLGAAGLSLFPRPHELDTFCSCPDVANPCKHVAAVHYVLAQTFDADPFLLPALRGRDRAALLAALRVARMGDDAVSPAVDDGPGEGVPLSALSAATLYQARADLAAIFIHPRTTGDPAASLQRLGAPPGFPAGSDDILAETARQVAERGWQIASQDDDDDPLLAAVCERGSASAEELRTALGWSAAEVRAGLRALREAGLVHRTGHARTTRYQA